MASPVIYQRKLALIIGINDYPRDPLNYCINDAADLKTALQNINFYISLGKPRNLGEFYNIVDTFANTIQREDLVLFYFAGHGKQNKDENYLLPSDYDYDHRGHERDYIVNHAINVKYIMKKIDDKKCRITIYLFDCCRKLVKTRAINANQGLLPMHAPLQTLIVFACAPGKAVLDETRNNRNGSFIQNLLNYIATPNRDIEEIMKDVACDVNKQTGGFQLPYRASCLTGKVFLVTDNDQEHHSTAWLKTGILESDHHDTSSTDINILLLGPTNVGKTTFINAFANYLTYDTFGAALRGNIQVLIPFMIYHFDLNTWESFEIKGGTPNENEWCHIPCVSWTQICQTYSFTIDNRLLRIIDTPPIGDTRGPLQDIKNMQQIFTYISKYKHLNSVCILMEADVVWSTRSAVEYLYYIKELLSHFHIHTHQNITWVFTNARTAHFRPGGTLRLLWNCFNDISNVSFHITQENCFVFDNETFRGLTLNKDHSEFVHSHLSHFKKSWDKSTAAFGDLMSYTLSYKPHMICETFFLHIARQLIYKLMEFINDKTSSRLSEASINIGSSAWNLEKVFIHNVCVSLAQFIKVNSILPFNNDIYTYCKAGRWEELRNQNHHPFDNLLAGSKDLEKLLMTNIDERTALFDVSTRDYGSQMNDILKLLDELCALPISGEHIRYFMKDLEKDQRDVTGQEENIVMLPKSAESSALMGRLRALIKQN